MQLFVKGLPFQQVFTTLQFVKLGAAQVFVDLPQLALGVGKLADRRINLFPAEALAGFEPMPPGDQVECSLVATVLTFGDPGFDRDRGPQSKFGDAAHQVGDGILAQRAEPLADPDIGDCYKHRSDFRQVGGRANAALDEALAAKPKQFLRFSFAPSIISIPARRSALPPARSRPVTSGPRPRV